MGACFCIGRECPNYDRCFGKPKHEKFFGDYFAPKDAKQRIADLEKSEAELKRRCQQHLEHLVEASKELTTLKSLMGRCGEVLKERISELVEDEFRYVIKKCWFCGATHGDHKKDCRAATLIAEIEDITGGE